MKANEFGVRRTALLVVTAFFLLFTASAAVAGIVNTKHNLSNSSTNDVFAVDVSQICVFCHTPHGSDITATVPLWNKGYDLSTTYTTYASLGTTTLDSEQAFIGSVSLACLSCHDGGQALDVMINAPGPGWGVGDGTSAVSQNYTFNNGNNQFGINERMSGITFIGVDLSNDHPIGVQYGGGGITEGEPDNPTIDDDFTPPQYADIGTMIWWIDTPTGTPNKRDKTDLPLYTRSNAYIDQEEPEPFVECASCHNPHTETETFLRTPDVPGLQLCQNCHTL